MLATLHAAIHVVAIPLDILNLVLAAILPIATALIAARFAPSAIKSIVLLGLTVLAVALQGVFANNGILHLREFIITTVLQFLLAVGAHFGFLKPVGVTGADGAVARAVPGGVGGDVEAGESPLR